MQPHEDIMVGNAASRGGPYAWYVLAILILACMVSFVDRQILTLMVGPIRETLYMTGIRLGSALAAGFTDKLFASDTAIGSSLALTIAFSAPVSALLLWRSGRPYRTALARVKV